MEAKAIARYIRHSPDKMRKVSNGIYENHAGNISDALSILKLQTTRAARVLEKVMKSALANALKKNMDSKKIRIKFIEISEGPGLKRMRPLGMGRATIIKRRTSHVKIVLTDEK